MAKFDLIFEQWLQKRRFQCGKLTTDGKLWQKLTWPFG